MKIPMAFSIGVEKKKKKKKRKKNPKMHIYMEPEKTPNSQSNLEKKLEASHFLIPYYKAIIIKKNCIGLA